MKKMKQELKELASEIRDTKPQRKLVHFTGKRTMGHHEAQYRVERLSSEYRHKHIAYCLMRGRTMDQIEQPAEDNKHQINV